MHYLAHEFCHNFVILLDDVLCLPTWWDKALLWFVMVNLISKCCHEYGTKVTSSDSSLSLHLFEWIA